MRTLVIALLLSAAPAAVFAQEEVFVLGELQSPTTPPAPASNLLFYQDGDYALFNLGVDWAINERITASVGGTNLTDQNYTLVDGFSEAGRSVYASLRVRY